MSSLEFENDASRPKMACCENGYIKLQLADGRRVSAPLWWYPFLNGLSDSELNDIELMYEGIWWNAVDEGISVKSILLGRKSPDAVEPELDAAE